MYNHDVSEKVVTPDLATLLRCRTNCPLPFVSKLSVACCVCNPDVTALSMVLPIRVSSCVVMGRAGTATGLLLPCVSKKYIVVDCEATAIYVCIGNSS